MFLEISNEVRASIPGVPHSVKGAAKEKSCPQKKRTEVLLK
jgi:hypothetical protein